MVKKVCIVTLGCKVNKYESDCLSRVLEDEGMRVVETLEKSDYYIINTCAVTNEAEKKSRQQIAKIKKIDENAKIIVCGCAVEKNVDLFQKKDNVVAVIKNQRKDQIVEFVKNGNCEDSLIEIYNGRLVDPEVNQARAYIKIQDGCNRFCTYCIIPYVRGRSVSRDLESIVKEAHKLAQLYNEIVIVGIDMSDYRVDGKLALSQLMTNLSDVTARIRLGSLEVSVINEEMLEILKQMPNFAPHFHLSLQSGDDFVLKKMNRKYSSEDYISAVNLIKKYFPNANITTDLIVGFPYENNENFANSINLIKKVGFGKVHCFPFSAKKGTVAYNFPKVDPCVQKERMKIAEEVAKELLVQYNSQFLDKTLNVLIEEVEGDYFVGYSENYIKCYLKVKGNSNVKIGEIITLKGVSLYKEGLEVIYGE